MVPVLIKLYLCEYFISKLLGSVTSLEKKTLEVYYAHILMHKY